MSPVTAILEVVEFILPTRTGRWGSQHSIDEVNVCVNRLQDSDGEAAVTFELRISAYGPGVVLLRSEDLIESCPGLLSLGSEGSCPASEVAAISPISCVLKTQSYSVFSIIETKGGIPRVTVKSTPSSKKTVPPEITVSLQCYGPAAKLRMTMEQLQPFVYQYKVVHPMVVFQLLSCIGDKVKQFELRLERKPYITVSSHINVIMDVSFFTGTGSFPLPSCHRVVKPVSGGSFTFPFPSLCSGESRPLLRCTAVGLLIPPGGPTDGVLPANWSQLWFSVYGPGSIPLAHPSTGSLEGILNLQHLVSWEDLGLALANEEAGEETGPKMPPIKANFIPDASLTLRSPATSLPPLLIVMVFLTENFKGGTTSVKQKKDLLRRVRQEFPHIWAQQFGRIRGIVGDTLASLLGNLPARRDRKAVMEKAISLSSSALCSIIAHSTNDSLRQHCLEHMQATNTKELGEKLVEKLTVIGMGPLGVSQCGHESQPQFPPKVHDEDETISALDVGNLGGVPEQLSPWRTTPVSAKMEVSDEADADFDLLDDTGHVFHRLVEETRQAHQCPSPTKTSLHPSCRLSVCPELSGQLLIPPSSSSSSSLPSTFISLPSKFESCQSPHRHGNLRVRGLLSEVSSGRGSQCEGQEETGKCQVHEDDLKMIRETLSGELGSDWFESLMDHDD